MGVELHLHRPHRAGLAFQVYQCLAGGLDRCVSAAQRGLKSFGLAYDRFIAGGAGFNLHCKRCGRIPLAQRASKVTLCIFVSEGSTQRLKALGRGRDLAAHLGDVGGVGLHLLGQAVDGFN
ncbi:hypothetical protein D3C81_1924330 [compost metagenome]